MFKKHPVLAGLLAALGVVVLAFIVTGILIMNAGAGTGPAVECQYLLVLGTKVNGTVPSDLLADRIRAAYEYLTANPDVICIVTGGKGDVENLSEAQCMFNELTALGIDESRIWLEDRAATTEENFRFSLALIEERTGGRPDRVGVLSSEFHLLRAGIFAREQNVGIITIPAKTSDFGTLVRYLLREIPLVWYYATIG